MIIDSFKVFEKKEAKIKKRYKKIILKGIGNLISERGLFQESSEEILLNGESVRRVEKNVFGILSCGCTVVEPSEIKICSMCLRSVCEKHSTECGGSIVCLSCCSAQGDPDPITCLSCSLKNSLRRILSGLIKKSRKTKSIIRKK